MFKRGGSSKKYFGVAIDANNGTVPTLISRSVDFLNQYLSEPGLFRISGQQSVINELRGQWDKGQSPTFDAKMNPHNVAGLLKLYLREMPEPLFTHSRYSTFLETAKKTPHEARVEATKTLLHGLPPTYYKASQQLLGLLYNIASNSDVNNMKASNIALIFVPCMLRPKVESFDFFVTDTPLLNSVFTFIVENYPVLFDVPGKCLNSRAPAAEPTPVTPSSPAPSPTSLAAAVDAIPLPDGSSSTNAPPPEANVDPVVWNFREESYKVMSKLYEWTNLIVEEIANVQSISELVFLASLVWQARTAITKELTEELPNPTFDLVVVKNPQPREAVLQLLAYHGDTIIKFTDDVAAYVEQMGQYMSLVETLEPLKPVDARFRWLEKVLQQSERVLSRHDGVNPSGTGDDSAIDITILENFMPEDAEDTGAIPEDQPPPAVDDIPPPSVIPPPAEEIPPPPVTPEEPKLGPPPAVPEEPKLGPPPAVPEEPKLGPPPAVPEEPKANPPPPVVAQKVQPEKVQPKAQPAQTKVQTAQPKVQPAQTKVQPAQPAQQKVQPAQQKVQPEQKVAPAVVKQAPAASPAKATSPAKPAMAPMNTLMLAKQSGKPGAAPSPVKQQPPRAGPTGPIATATAPQGAKAPQGTKISGEALAAPIMSLVSILKFLKNDALQATSSQQRTLLDTGRRLELLVDNPFKDVAELLMMDASMGAGSGTSAVQQLGKACDKAVATLLRILPMCTAEMPAVQARLVATFVRRIVEIIHTRDESELLMFQ